MGLVRGEIQDQVEHSPETNQDYLLSHAAEDCEPQQVARDLEYRFQQHRDPLLSLVELLRPLQGSLWGCPIPQNLDGEQFVSVKISRVSVSSMCERQTIRSNVRLTLTLDPVPG